MSGSNIPTEDFTYMVWINMGSNTDETIFMASNGHASAENELGLYVTSGSKLSVNMNDVTGVVTGTTTLNTGQWYHVVLTRNSDEVKVYVNGVVDGTETQSSTLNFGSCSLYIGVDIDSGCDSSKGNYFNGSIDEFMVFDRALSEEQISALYNNQTDVIVSQETYTGEVWETCVTPNDNVRDGTKICSNNITVAGAQIGSVVLNSSSGNNYTSDNLTATPVNMLPSGANAIYDWKKNGNSVKIFEMTFDGETLCNGGTTVCDYIGAQNGTPTTSGTIEYFSTSGYNGTGVYNFNGDDFINVNPDIALTDSFSISAWVRRGSISGTADMIFSTGETNADNRRLVVGFNYQDYLWFDFGNNFLISTTTVVDNDWHYLVFTYNWNTRERNIYLDGINMASDISSADPDLDLPTETRIGNTTFAGDYSYDGKIDEVVVWDTELSIEHISAMYNNGNYRQDVIFPEQTAYGDVWSVCATPNNNLMHGDEVCSNNLTIQGIDIALTSSSGNNYSTDNLTASVSGLMSGDKAFYNWELDGSSIMALNMPMDGGALCQGNTRICDYAGGNNGTITNVIYNSTAGYDGKGAMEFDGSNGQYISFPQQSGLTDLSIALWIKRDSLGSSQHLITGPSAGTNQDTFIIVSDKLTFYHCGSIIQSSSTIDTEWHHVAVTRDYSANVVNFYIDGEFDSSGSCTTPTKTYDLHTIGSEGNSYTQTFNGTIDEVMIFNRALTAEQISALYNNQTNKIVSQETIYEDNWSVCATPNDNVRNGAKVCSNSLIVESVGVVLNSSSGTNLTIENLTVAVPGLFGEDKVFYDWKIDGNSIMALNMPFDGGTLAESNTKVKDYSSNGNNGTVINATYNSTGGYDGKGAYEFDGSNNRYISISGGVQNMEDVTFSSWIRLNTVSNYPHIIAGTDTEDLFIFFSSSGILMINECSNSNLVSTTNFTELRDWHFVSFSRDYSTKELKIYVDGVLETTGLCTSNPLFDLNILGGEGDFFTQAMNGSIDEVQIYNRVLSPEQVSALYNNRTDLIVSQETTYGDVWQACVTPNDNVRNDGLVCSNNLTVENIDVALTSTDVLTNFSSENLTASVSGLISGDRVIYNWKKDGSSIAILNMPFDGGALCGGKVCDYSSTGNNGTVSGAIYNSTGGYDGKGAYEFDGVDGMIEIDYSDDFNFSNISGFTVMARVKPNDLVVNDADIVTQYHSPSNNRSWILQIRNGVLRFFGCSNGSDSGSCEYATGTTLANNSGTWYHLAGTWNGSKLQVYLNGVADDSTPPTLTSLHSGARSIRLGYDAASEDYNGTIDEVLIFDRALSPEQISAMYNNGSYRTNIIVSNETLTDEDWQACVTANTGENDGKEVCSSILTVLADMTINTSVTPYVVTNGSSVTLNMSVLSSAEAVNATWANLTYPNGTIITINSFAYVFADTSTAGRYNVTFYANDSSGDRVSYDDYFESFASVTFNFTIIDFDTSGVDSSWEFRYRDTIIESNTTATGNHSTSIPDVLGDLRIKSHSNRLQITLEDINATLENGKNFGMDKWTTAETGYLVTYGVSNSYAFTNAVVKIYYDDLGVSDVGNLQLWKCENFDFGAQSCSGTWTDITSSSTQNTGNDYFEYNATSFSGFSIKQYVAPTTTETTTSEEGGGGGLACKKGYEYVNGTCVELEGIPSELFDITWNLDDKIMKSVSKLVGIITFESFGTVPTLVDLTFIILDESENEIYNEESEITVTTEEVLRWKYETLSELPKGKYTAVLKTLYNVDVFDEFKQEFEIDGESVLTTYAKRNWVWYLSGLVGIIIIGVLVWFGVDKFRKKYRKEPSSFEGRVSKILSEAKVK